MSSIKTVSQAIDFAQRNQLYGYPLFPIMKKARMEELISQLNENEGYMFVALIRMDQDAINNFGANSSVQDENDKENGEKTKYEWFALGVTDEGRLIYAKKIIFSSSNQQLKIDSIENTRKKQGIIFSKITFTSKQNNFTLKWLSSYQNKFFKLFNQSKEEAKHAQYDAYSESKYKEQMYNKENNNPYNNQDFEGENF